MAKRRTKVKLSGKPRSDDVEFLLKDPQEAADQIDAILFFLHRRYGANGASGDLPTMRTFLIQSMDVIFTDAVKQITVEKRMDDSALRILAPKTNKFEEEARRIFLLNEFGDLLIKCQKQGLEQLRDMLLGVLDAKGRGKLVSEYVKYKKRQVSQGV